MSAPAPSPQPFPRTFYVANGIELLERLAFYGMYIGLSLYLTKEVGLGDVESGRVMGNYRLLASLAPVPCGMLADRISFRSSLLIAFSVYSLAYLTLYAFPLPAVAPLALMGVAIGGGFMKPVIVGTVVRTSPEGRQAEGFGIFNRMVNSGSVVGKTLAYQVRVAVGLLRVMINSVVASLMALGLAATLYREPEKGRAAPAPVSETLKGLWTALSDLRFTGFLLVFGGFYFMADQFYMTFPKYVTRHIDPQAPMEVITLVNPATIALFQGQVTRLTARLAPLQSMVLGLVIGSVAMLAMGAMPTLWGAALSGALFAVAEMCFSPRFLDYVGSVAPSGKAGLYMGLSFVPAAVGGWTGGLLSGPLVARYLPADGPRFPIFIWSIYAGLGLATAAVMWAYGTYVLAPRPKPAT